MLECQADNGGCGELELAACAELRGAAPICSDIAMKVLLRDKPRPPPT